MITRRFAVDDDVVCDGDLPPGAAAELSDTVDRVGRWGGSVRTYRHFLSRGLRLGPTAADLRSIAVLAAWRAGVPRLRADALCRTAELDAEMVEATLGLPPGGASGFVAAQAVDPFGYPGAGALIGIVGGFRGLGGPWLEVPRNPLTIGPSRVAVTSGADWWSVDADVFGAEIRPLAAAPPPADGLLHGSVGASYHLWLLRGAR